MTDHYKNVQSRKDHSDTSAKSRRFEDRDTHLFDLVHRFEANPAWKHIYDARSAIERLRDEGTSFWKEGAPQLDRWRHYCNTLWTFIQTSLGERRHKDPAVTETLRVFFQEFEHSSHGIREMLHGIPDCVDKEHVSVWLNLVFISSTYAITAFWLNDKAEEVALKISINLKTGEKSEETVVEKAMTIPRKHRRGAKDL